MVTTELMLIFKKLLYKTEPDLGLFYYSSRKRDIIRSQRRNKKDDICRLKFIDKHNTFLHLLFSSHK